MSLSLGPWDWLAQLSVKELVIDSWKGSYSAVFLVLLCWDWFME